MASLPPEMDRAMQDQFGAGLRDVAASLRTSAEQVAALVAEVNRMCESKDKGWTNVAPGAKSEATDA